MKMQVRSLASLSGLRISVAMSWGVGHRHGSDRVLLWLWCRLPAVAPIRPLAWELPYATGAALKKDKKKRCGLFETPAMWDPSYFSATYTTSHGSAGSLTH